MNFLTILFPLLLIITTAYSSPVADKKADSGPAVADAVPLSEQQKKQIKDAIESAPVVQEIPITGELAETIKKLYQSRGGVVAENEEPETEEYVTGEYESGSYEAQESAENGTAPVIPHKPLKIRRSGPMPQGKPIRVVAAGPGRQMTQVIQTRFINGKPQFRVVTRTKNTAITDTASVIAGASKDIANLISGAVQTGADGWTTINEAASNVISKAAGTSGKIIDKILGTEIFHQVGEVVSGGAQDLLQGLNEGIQSVASMHTGISRGVAEIIASIAHQSADLINNVVMS